MKVKAVVATTALATGIASTGLVPAHAAGTPPQDAVITLISPVLDATNTADSAKNLALGEYWVSMKWYGEGLVFQRAYVPIGSTVNLTYHVVDKNGQPVVNQDVMLRVNKGYSISTSMLQVDNSFTSGVDKQLVDQANVTHKTDAFGNVTFAIIDLDKAPLGEKKPAKLTDPTLPDGDLTDLHSQMLPQVAGQMVDHSVITEFHYYTDSSPEVVPATHPTIRLVSPGLTDTNSIHREDLEKKFTVENTWYAPGLHFRQVYAPVGSKLTLVYQVTGDDGKTPLANTKVKLHVNKAYSGSNASITDGKTATDATKDSTQGNDQALLEGTTDALGFVLFDLKNTDVNGEAKPATPLTAAPTTGGTFSQIFPEITGGATDIADMVEFHFYGVPVAPLVPAVTAKATKATVKGKTVYTMNITVKNANGKTAAVSITGLKAGLSASITSASQVLKYVVTKGKKTVKITIDGKSYTSTVVVK